MVIRRIEICNFRLFYKNNVFELSDGLNVLVGSSGDGKTTFFDALDWLFRTEGTNKMDSWNISRKRIEELISNDSDHVRVAMTYEHSGKTKVLEKMFLFSKSDDGGVSTSNYSFSLMEEDGLQRFIKEGVYFDKDLPPEIRPFIMFKDEGYANILQASNAMKLFIDSFSNANDFNAYFSFMEFAEKKAELARDCILKIERYKKKRLNNLLIYIGKEETIISDIEREIKERENEVANYEELLKNILDYEPLQLMTAVNNRISCLSEKRVRTEAQIQENYSHNLLQDMWVLVGFETIAKEYSDKVHALSKEQKRLESEYLKSVIAENGVEKLLLGKTSDMNYPQLFKHDFITELLRKDVLLNNDSSNFTQMPNIIQEAIAHNNRLHSNIKTIDTKLDYEYEQKKRILVQTDSLSEEQLLANYENIFDWMDKKTRAENRINILKHEKELHRSRLEEAQQDLCKLSEDTSAALYTKTTLAFKHINEAFKSAQKEQIKRNIMAIEDKANMFLYQLFQNEYTGTIRIAEKMNGQAEYFLVDSNNTRIFKPGRSLEKTCQIALMLAIGEILSDNRHLKYPFIMDGAISCYDNPFGNSLVDNINRQMIIITSDYLDSDHKDGTVLKKESFLQHSKRTYFMKKKVPFDNKKLSTIEIRVSLIN